jgi:putative hydrolase of the HAD superfamily
MPVTRADPTLKAIIFDFGGVLVRTRSQDRRISWEQHLGLARGEAEALVFGGESGTAAQHGRITDEAHWRWLGERLKLPPDDLDRFRADFFADDVLDESLVSYADRLREAGYHLGLLSNASDIARKVFAETYGVLGRFDSVTISCEEGVMKPDPRIYQVALRRAGVEPGEAVFVDDVAANIEGARQVGMRGVHFRSTEQAIADLAALTGVTPGQ